MNRPVIGAGPTIYANTAAPEWITDSARTGGKAGQACSSSVLGIVTTGEATVADAARKAGISKIAYTENTFENVLGIWARYCIVVHGD